MGGFRDEWERCVCSVSTDPCHTKKTPEIARTPNRTIALKTHSYLSTYVLILILNPWKHSLRTLPRPMTRHADYSTLSDTPSPHRTIIPMKSLFFDKIIIYILIRMRCLFFSKRHSALIPRPSNVPNYWLYLEPYKGTYYKFMKVNSSINRNRKVWVLLKPRWTLNRKPNTLNPKP